MVAKYFAPPQTIKGVLYVGNGVRIFAGDGIDSIIVKAKPV